MLNTGPHPSASPLWTSNVQPPIDGMTYDSAGFISGGVLKSNGILLNNDTVANVEISSSDKSMVGTAPRITYRSSPIHLTSNTLPSQMSLSMNLPKGGYNQTLLPCRSVPDESIRRNAEAINYMPSLRVTGGSRQLTSDLSPHQLPQIASHKKNTSLGSPTSHQLEREMWKRTDCGNLRRLASEIHSDDKNESNLTTEMDNDDDEDELSDSSLIPYPFPLPLPPDDSVSPASGTTLPQLRRQLGIFCREQLLEFAAYVMWSCLDACKIGEMMLEADPSTRRVMVRGLLFSTSDDMFYNYFATFGELENAAIIRHADGRSQGYGFLIYKSRLAAERVVTERHILDGRPITTKLAADARHHSSRHQQGIPPRGTVDRRKLFIRNIRADITKEVLMEQFSVYGPIEECAIIPTAAGASKGYGFVTFKRARDALKAAQLPFRMINSWIVFVAFSTGKGRNQNVTSHGGTNRPHQLTSELRTSDHRNTHGHLNLSAQRKSATYQPSNRSDGSNRPPPPPPKNLTISQMVGPGLNFDGEAVQDSTLEQENPAYQGEHDSDRCSFRPFLPPPAYHSQRLNDPSSTTKSPSQHTLTKTRISQDLSTTKSNFEKIGSTILLNEIDRSLKSFTHANNTATVKNDPNELHLLARDYYSQHKVSPVYPNNTNNRHVPVNEWSSTYSQLLATKSSLSSENVPLYGTSGQLYNTGGESNMELHRTLGVPQIHDRSLLPNWNSNGTRNPCPISEPWVNSNYHDSSSISVLPFPQRLGGTPSPIQTSMPHGCSRPPIGGHNQNDPYKNRHHLHQSLCDKSQQDETDVDVRTTLAYNTYNLCKAQGGDVTRNYWDHHPLSYKHTNCLSTTSPEQSLSESKNSCEFSQSFIHSNSSVSTASSSNHDTSTSGCVDSTPKDRDLPPLDFLEVYLKNRSLLLSNPNLPQF